MNPIDVLCRWVQHCSFWPFLEQHERMILVIAWVVILVGFFAAGCQVASWL